MVCREATACARGDKIYKAYAPQLGFDVVYQAQSSIAQPDFTAECLNAKAAGAEVFFVLMDINSLGRIAGACARQGYRPTFAFHQNTAVPANAANPALENAAIAGTAFPWFANDTVATAEFQSLMARYAPGMPVIGNHAVGWVAAKLFERATQNLSEPPTAAAILDGLWSIRNDDLGGLTYPLTFIKDEPAPTRICWFDIRIRNGGFIAPNGPRASCRDR
jgi:branched-chain amino acid transport system substrate-binding protein